MKTNQLKRFFRMAAVLLSAVAMAFVASCSDSDNENDNENSNPVIKLTGGTTTQQTVYADETQKSDNITFKAPAPWTASVAEVQTKAEATAITRAEAGRVDWLELSAYEGNAGEMSLTMTLKVNTTGQDRKAEIRIVCGGTTLTITVEQKGTKQNGELPDEAKPEEPSNPDNPEKPNLKGLVSTITAKGLYENTICRFIYDETTGRLAKIEETIHEDNETRTATTVFTYGEGTVSYEYKEYQSNNKLYGQNSSSIVLDEKGRAVSGKIVGFDSWKESTAGYKEEWNTIYTLSYDAEGYLKETEEKSAYGDDNFDPADDEYPMYYYTTWTDGNPTQVKWGSKEGSEDVKNLDRATYGTMPNTTNLDLNWLCILHYSEGFAFSVGDNRDIFAAMGYTGKRPKNMVETVSSSDDGIGGSNDYRYTYEYELDKDGRIHKITETYCRTGETDTNPTMYTITYTE